MLLLTVNISGNMVLVLILIFVPSVHQQSIWAYLYNFYSTMKGIFLAVKLAFQLETSINKLFNL